MLALAPDRDQQELGFLMILGVSLMSSEGFAAAELEDVCRRALVLCARRNASSQAFKLERLLGLFHYFRAELQPCLVIVDQLLKSANDLRDPQLVIEAHRAYGVTLVDVGRFRESMEHLDQVPPLRSAHPRPSHGAFPGQDRSGGRELRGARALGAQLRTGAGRINRAMSVARDLSHPESIIVATCFRARPSTSWRNIRGETARNCRRTGRRMRSPRGLLWAR